MDRNPASTPVTRREPIHGGSTSASLLTTVTGVHTEFLSSESVMQPDTSGAC